MSMGGHGCISVAANIAPKQCSDFHTAWRAGDLATAQKINESLMPLHGAIFSDTSPQPTKYALEKMGKIDGELRLPLIPASDKAKGLVDAAMTSLGL